MPPKAKPKADDEVEYKVIECTSTTALNIESELNDLAQNGWRVITAVQRGSRLILERDL